MEMCFIYHAHVVSSVFVGFVQQRMWYFRAADNFSIGSISGNSEGGYKLIHFIIDLLVCIIILPKSMPHSMDSGGKRLLVQKHFIIQRWSLYP